MKDRTYFEEKFKKCPFYWGFLEIESQILLEILEEVRLLNKQMQEIKEKQK